MGKEIERMIETFDRERRRLGLSWAEVGAGAFISPATISQLLKRRAANSKTIEKLMKFFDMELRRKGKK